MALGWDKNQGIYQFPTIRGQIVYCKSFGHTTHTNHRRRDFNSLPFKIGSVTTSGHESGNKGHMRLRPNDVAWRAGSTFGCTIGDQLFFGQYDFCAHTRLRYAVPVPQGA